MIKAGVMNVDNFGNQHRESKQMQILLVLAPIASRVLAPTQFVL